MLHGRAFLVTHPRRRGQDYVSCNLVHLARDIKVTTIQCGWTVQVQLINYVGDEALSVTTTMSDLLSMLPPAALDKVTRVD